MTPTRLPEKVRQAASLRAQELIATPAADEPPPDSVSEDEIFRRVTHYRWRRTRVDPASAQDFRGKIADRLRTRQPLEFSVPFGGYKAWHQPSAPHLNWAEAMWIDHLRSYGSSVAAAYPGPVQFCLTYYSGVLDIVDNIPLADQLTYTDELAALLARRSSDRVAFRLVDLAELHGGREQLRADLLAAIAQETTEPDAAQLASARRNLRPAEPQVGDPLDPRDSAADPAPALAAARACIAMEGLPPRRQFNKLSHRIQIGHIRGPSLTLHLGSTRSATMQPWVASGFLQSRSDGSLLESLARRLPPVEYVPVDAAGVISPGLQLVPVAPAEALPATSNVG